IFGHKGPVALVEGDRNVDLLALLAVTTSSAFSYLVGVQMAFGSYEVGVIQRTPVPELRDSDRDALVALARRSWSLKRSLDADTETSHAFLLPHGVNERTTGHDRKAIERELGSLQKRIDEAVFRLYGLGPEDSAAIQGLSEQALASNHTADE